MTDDLPQSILVAGNVLKVTEIFFRTDLCPLQNLASTCSQVRLSTVTGAVRILLMSCQLLMQVIVTCLYFFFLIHSKFVGSKVLSTWLLASILFELRW